MKKTIGIIIFILLFPAVGFFVYIGQHKDAAENSCYSGTIETTRSNLAFQVNGRIVAVYADEGDHVEEGELLARLDAALYQAKYMEVRSMLDQSKKNLERSQILLEVYRDTLPADVKRAEAGVKSARALAREAKNDKGRYDELKSKNAVSQRAWEGVNLKYETAMAQLSEAEAVLEQAISNLKKIELTRKEIQTLEAQNQAATAAVNAAQIQLDYTELSSPFEGVVTTRGMELGEVVTPAKEVLTLSELKTVELKIFVGEEEIGKVIYGEKASVKIDTYPDRTYAGTVSFVSQEAEFTPKIIQTHKERVKLVYMVKLTIPNSDFSLKPGMPADACFQDE